MIVIPCKGGNVKNGNEKRRNEKQRNEIKVTFSFTVHVRVCMASFQLRVHVFKPSYVCMRLLLPPTDAICLHFMRYEPRHPKLLTSNKLRLSVSSITLIYTRDTQAVPLLYVFVQCAGRMSMSMAGPTTIGTCQSKCMILGLEMPGLPGPGSNYAKISEKL